MTKQRYITPDLATAILQASDFLGPRQPQWVRVRVHCREAIRQFGDGSPWQIDGMIEQAVDDLLAHPYLAGTAERQALHAAWKIAGRVFDFGERPPGTRGTQ